MFQIGLFSKMNQITTKTLRHYDDLRLLKPAFVDDFTGYRYYTSEQLPRLHMIIALKQMGISLAHIGQLVDESGKIPSVIELFLELGEKELRASLEENKKQLDLIQNYQKRIRGDHMLNYNPIIKSLPEVIVASMETVVPSYDTYFDIVPKMGDEMRKQGAVCAMPEYCFTIYHDGEYRESDIHVEVCESVVDYCEDSEMVTYKLVHKVCEAVCILHKGPYETLVDAYGFIFKWIEQNGYQVAGQLRESYIDGIWNMDSKNDWLTEIQVPVSRL
ncbi:MAG: MerR family transcriptional regulator [Vallitaleaceae bacterium]|jgi:DNA-binding transcriptional MerR regulator|nr:MerR family transcriptional regulator [Vallitaleaceae bacterium]